MKRCCVKGTFILERIVSGFCFLFLSRCFMSNIQRLKKCLSRQGIKVQYQNQIYRLKSAHCSASVLLPETFKLEEKAVKQLLQFAGVQIPGTSGHVCQACATQDFHPGSIAPVGSIVATTPDMVIPAAIRTDINCGMRLIKTGIPLQQKLEKQRELEALLTAVLLQHCLMIVQARGCMR